MRLALSKGQADENLFEPIPEISIPIFLDKGWPRVLNLNGVVFLLNVASAVSREALCSGWCFFGTMRRMDNYYNRYNNGEPLH